MAQRIRGRWRFAQVFGLVSALAAGPSPAVADTATVPALTAAFLYNFVKFTIWPPDALKDGQRLLLCVADDAPVADALAQVIEGRAVEGHQLQMTVVDSLSDVRACHVFYVGSADTDRAIAMIERVRDVPVFTVGRAQRFAARGGVGELIVDGSRMRFAINVASARRVRLELSSRLLSLAEIVKVS